MKENIVIKYRHTALSYLLSTLIPWAFWLAASYGTDSLRSRMNLFKTSVLFAAYWAVWYFHLAGIRGYYHANIAQEGWLYILNFIVSVFSFIILMNWLYYKPIEIFSLPSSSTSQQGISTRSSPLIPTASAYKTMLLLVLSIIIVLKGRRFFIQPDIGMIPIHSPKNTYIMTQEEYNQSFTHLLF